MPQQGIIMDAVRHNTWHDWQLNQYGMANSGEIEL